MVCNKNVRYSRRNQANVVQFISLYELLAQYDPAAKAYLDELHKVRSS